MTYRAGVDIGGTFTDIVLLADDGAVITRKVPSTPEDYSRGIAEGLTLACREEGLDAGEITHFLHGTTVATNALLERTGALTGLVTTEGFRDVLEIRRLRMPRLYDIAYQKPETLVRRALRFEVPERIDFRGEVIRPLDEAAARSTLARLLASGVESIAICLYNAYANGAHERRLRDLLREQHPDIPVSLSSEVLPELREYERTSTTVVNAYLTPLVKGYLRRLSAELGRCGIGAPVRIMQSNGGAMGVGAACARPVNMIESGPAAGVVGAAALAGILGFEDVLTFDMGGTTAKAAIISGGAYAHLNELDVGAGINSAGRLMQGGGYHVRVPAIDLAEVGTGGGSLVRLDPGGSVRVGPDSAGAVPGPVAYRMGGRVPTVTDANLLLGYLNPHHLVGGALALDRDRARCAIREQIADPLGLTVPDAALGIHRVADAEMSRALRAVSSERGRDPRDYAMMAFGGNGPLHGASLAENLGMTRIILPPAAGVFSALGLLFPEAEQRYARTCKGPIREVSEHSIRSILRTLEGEGRRDLAAEGFSAERVAFEHLADVRYAGENSELTLPFPALRGGWRDAVAARFHERHDETYGYASAEEVVELVSLRVIARGRSERSRIPTEPVFARGSGDEGPWAEREVYFAGAQGWRRLPVLPGRTAIPDSGVEGPAIVEEYDSTTLVPPGWRLDHAAWGCTLLTRVR